MITSRLTTKSQTTLPRAVRSALGVSAGDQLAYRIDGDSVVLSKASIRPTEDPFVTFTEWNGDADRKAYADL